MNTTDEQLTKKTKNLWRTIWLIFMGLVATAVWRIIRYWHRLFRQPRLRPLLPGVDTDVMAEIERMAYNIASRDVRDCIEMRQLSNGDEKQVLCAGVRNFREPWARDFGFACFGLLAMGEVQTVQDGLEMFFDYQRPNGQFPVKMHSTNVMDRYLHSLFHRQQPIHTPMRPKYITAHNTISLDGNALLLIAALYYVQETGDDTFVQTYWPHLQRGLAWLDTHTHDDDGLLHQGAFTDWADSIARTGHILYTNVLYWRALEKMAQTADRYNLTQAQSLHDKANRLKQAILNHFWRDDLGFFVTSEQFANLSSCGNLLAITWGLASESQAKQVLDIMAEMKMADPVPTQVTSYPYPLKFIGIENRLAGIPHYHTEAAWLWLGGWHVVALLRANRYEEANALLARMGVAINRDGVVHEVYGRDGRPLATRWYRSEAPLTWNASMYLYAYHSLRQYETEIETAVSLPN